MPPRAMMSDDDFQYFCECIEAKDVSDRLYALTRRRDAPTGDPRVLPLLEAALEDRAVAMIAKPPQFGELRLVAAQALAAERAVQGIDAPVTLREVPRPLSTDELSALGAEHRVRTPGGDKGLVMRYRILRDRGLLPLMNLG